MPNLPNVKISECSDSRAIFSILENIWTLSFKTANFGSISKSTLTSSSMSCVFPSLISLYPCSIFFNCSFLIFIRCSRTFFNGGLENFIGLSAVTVTNPPLCNRSRELYASNLVVPSSLANSLAFRLVFADNTITASASLSDNPASIKSVFQFI